MVLDFPRLRRGAIALLTAAGLALAAVPATARAFDPVETAGAPARPDRARVRMNQRVFDRVWNEVRTSYYDPRFNGVDWTAARATWRPQALAARDDRELYLAIDGMLGLLDDRHANASPPAVARRQDQLRRPRAVIGVTLAPQAGGGYLIEQVRAGSPAEAAGVAVGWRLRAGPGDWTPEADVVEGRAVTLHLSDAEGVERALTVTPQIMEPIPAFTVDRSRAGVLVLRIEGFERGMGRWLGEQLAGLPDDVDVVIDLRGNPGGLIDEAQQMLGCFLPPERAWAVRTSRSGERTTMSTGARCGDLTAPAGNDVAILVNRNSRSAAELTPAALQEAGRVVVVGERTAGSVLISRDTPLPDGGRLTLSRADFVTAGGVRLEKTGVEPDIVAVQTPDDRLAGRDPALDAAIAAMADTPAQADAGGAPSN